MAMMDTAERINAIAASTEVQFNQGMTMAAIERSVILETLRRQNANRTRAARVLGIGIRTLQRKLKDAGRFVYIDRVKNNPSFLRFIDSSLRYVADAGARLPEYGDLFGALIEVDPGIASNVRIHDRP